MTISYTRPLGTAIQHMRRMLFSPFDLGKWIAIGFSAFLAGLVDSNAGGGGSFSDDEAMEDIGDGIADLFSGGWEAVFASAVAVAVAAFILAAVILLVALCLWLSSRGKFMLLDNVATESSRISAPWSEYRREGNSLFWWRLGFTILTFGGAILVAGAAVLVLMPRGELFETASSIMVFILAILAFLLITLVYLFVSMLLDNFVIPIMYRRRIGATAAWRAFLPLLKDRLAEFILYGLFVLVLYVAIAVVLGIAGLLTCCVGFVLIAIPYVGSVIMLPVTVTYRAYGLEFLRQFGTEYWSDAEPPAENEPTTG